MSCRIAVCDDNPIDAAYVEKLLNIWAHEREIYVSVETFPSAEAFLFCYEEDKAFDFLLLDIEMGAMDGVALAKRVRREDEALQLIFITGYSDYITQGYDVSALHYLLKPVNREKFFDVLDRGMERWNRNQKFLNLELSGETVRVPLREIRYLDVCRNYVTIHGKKDYTVKRSLREFEHQLDTGFCRAGRSLILNLSFVRRVTRTEVYLSDQTVLPLPRGAYETVNREIIRSC
ncbi:MAG: response regulator transcription factor [Hungatella sp.]|nr:response regulator transcription factor [Hungatella sp.]